MIGAFQGFVIAYLGVPAFIVTLGGLLVWRGAAWWVASGRTLAPLDSNFQLIGGGGYGSIGATLSWIVGGGRLRRHRASRSSPTAASGGASIFRCARSGRRSRLPSSAALPSSAPSPSSTPIPCRSASPGNTPPTTTSRGRKAACSFSLGIAIPVLIALGVAIVMTFIATRTRFGRYVFAIGGNPEAAELGGINTRWIITKVFILMGVLCGISGAISSARLNAATNALGTLDELYVIAAAVIGGTSFAGGIGTIPGAMLGALVMQSLQSGMQLMGIDSPLQNIVVGIVLVFAVGIDTAYRRRAT